MRIRRPGLVAAVLIGIAVLRIASTFTTFSFTTDEPVHVGSGLELLQLHTYTLQRVNPPLPRIVFAALPTIGGMKWGTGKGFYQLEDQTFFHGGHYRTKLVLSRTGNLVFFILAALMLFVWARREIGDHAAILATLLFTTQPIILGYSAIANHDVPSVAGIGVSLVALSSWLRRPDARRAALLGAAYGFSVLMKFSCIAFVPAACGAIWIVRLLFRKIGGERAGAPLNFTLLLVPPVAAFTIWAGYAFTIEAFVEGVRGVLEFENQFRSYAFGRTTTKGWWWYFPAAVALKTTLPFLVAFAIGARFAWHSQYRRAYIEAAAATLAILAVAMPSSLDLGVRYVLPLYLPFSLATAAALFAWLEQPERWIRSAAIVLVVLHVAVSLLAHPDYFPYFNFLAGRQPGACLVDSNLDWGQDTLRLKAATDRLHIDRIGIAIPGNRATNAEFNELGLPPNYQLGPYRPRAGWVALGEHFYRIDRDGWRWLDAFPMQRVGTSIRLYNVPAGAGGDDDWDVEQVLLPLAGTALAKAGAVWRVDQTITNHGSAKVHLTRTNCESSEACELDVAPGQTVRIVGSDAIRPFIYVSVPRNVIDQLSFETVARRIDRTIPGSDVVVPAVRVSQFRQGPITFEQIPFSPDERLNLRLYVEERADAEALIKIRDDERVVAQTTVPIYDTRYYTHGDFSAQFPHLRPSGKNMQVTIETNARAWAFITATDADGRSTVFLPK